MVLIPGSITALIPTQPTLADLTGSLPEPPAIAATAFSMMQSNTAFANPVAGDLTSALGNVNSIFAAPGFPAAGAEFDALTAVLDSVAGMSDHTDGLVDNMPSMLSSASTMVKGTAAMSGLPGGPSLPADPCNLMDGIMGSVLGAANAAINAITDLLAPLIALIAGPIGLLVDAITAVLGPLLAAAAALAAFVINEAAKLAELLGGLGNFGLANSLPNLAQDPCLQGVLNAVGTPGLTSALSAEIPEFVQF